MLTYNNHLWSAIASAVRLGTDPADRWLTCLPLNHVGGLSIVFRCCLYGTAVVLQQGFDPAAVSRALETQDITLVSLVPTMLHRLLESHPSSLANSRLRCLLIGGAALSPALLERCRALGLPLALTYGLTEAASQVATASSAEVYRKPGSVGRPLMFSSVRIVDPHGQELPPGEIGEIVVRGPTVMHGYYRQPEATRQTLRSGELYTGDLGYLDDAGDLWVTQRRADLIVSGGENVYPAEVEQVLREHPAVGDACVVGLNDVEWGQRVAAVVVVRRSQAQVSEAELIAFCRTRLAGYKQPRLIRFIDALPQTASGKVQRDVVRQQLELGVKLVD
jgi:O-succinylbenzoic acid--CoA ligase